MIVLRHISDILIQTNSKPILNHCTIPTCYGNFAGILYKFKLKRMCKNQYSAFQNRLKYLLYVKSDI